ncbi:MAG: glycerol-3-phosphate 1-O-acyltransferase PlsY [Acidobacteria bacterium]|nr:glycerol-3-phosphate 1-O-acyltransferase PlsY [Acidobacteriota bacterium]
MEALLVLVGYFVGAIPFALLLTRRVGGTDVRRAGSGNVGAANVLRVANVPVAVSVMVLDVGKGCGVVLLARGLGASEATLAAVAAAAVVGHVFPVWLRFRGGKGVATASGVFWVLAPEATALALVAFTGVVWLTRYVSLGSMVAAVVLAAAVYFNGEAPATIVCAAGVAALVLYRHRGNMVRLHAGRERRISQRA